MGFMLYHHEVDSMVYDAYGTLTIPSGTYPNTIRIHRFNLSKDSTAFSGASLSFIESYEWYVAGFHHPLFTYTIDTSGGTMAEYYIQNAALAATIIAEPVNSLSVYPNPASDMINVDFNVSGNQPATITLSDLIGRTIMTSSVNSTSKGNNTINIPVANIPGGIYVIQLHTATGNITRKVSIAH